MIQLLLDSALLQHITLQNTLISYCKQKKIFFLVQPWYAVQLQHAAFISVLSLMLL